MEQAESAINHSQGSGDAPRRSGLEGVRQRTLDRMKRFLPRSDFVRHVILVAGGTAIGQVITLLASPFITRLYPPASFGVLAVYSSLLSVAMVGASLRYEVAIPVPDDHQTASNLLVLSLVSVPVIGLLVALLIIVMGERLSLIVNLPTIQQYLWLLPIGLIGSGFYQALNNWAIRSKAFHSIARTKLSQSGGQAITQLGLGLLHAGPVGLLAGDIIGRISGTGTLAALVWADRHGSLSAVSPSRLWAAAKRYWRFPLFSFWSAFLNAISLQVPVLMLSAFFGAAVVGCYSLSTRVLQIPIVLIGTAVAQVFFSSASQARRDGRTSELASQVLEQLVAVGLPFSAIIGIAAPELFSLVFGRAWVPAGLYTQWLTPWLFLNFLTGPLGNLVFVLERQNGDLWFQFLLTAGRIGMLYLGGKSGNPVVSVALFGVFGAVSLLGYLCWLMKISGNSGYVPLVTTGRAVYRTIPYVLPLVAAKALHAGTLAVCLAAALCAGIVFFRMLIQRTAN